MTTQIEGTNDSSCLSKLSAVSKTYFEDEFLSCFVTKYPRRAPLIHLGYSVRASIVNFLMEEFLLRNSKMQVVSLGAGFDTLFFKFKSKSPDLKVVYYELDLPGVVERKISCIQHWKKLSQLLDPYSVKKNKLTSTSGDYCLLAVDLRDVHSVRQVLVEHGLDLNLPTLFLSECAITYLEEKKSSELIQFASRFPNAVFVTYEQIHPDDTFGQVMVGHFASLHSPLMSVDRYPTLNHQRQRYIDHGWHHCTVMSALDAYGRILTVEEQRRVLRLEPFDEWEEFYLKCCHYAVIIASQGDLAKQSNLCSGNELLSESPNRPTLKWTLTECERAMRYGHSVVPYKDKLLLIGGFGLRKDGTHRRLNNVVKLKCENSVWRVAKEKECAGSGSMFTSRTMLDNKRFILYGGRTAPTQSVWPVPKVMTVLEEGVSICKDLVDACNQPARWRHTAVIAQRNNCDTFIVFGGRTSNLELLKDTWMINLRNEDVGNTKVETLPPQVTQPCPRFAHSSVVRCTNTGNDEMWTCGGLAEEGPLADVWYLDLYSGLWSEVPVVGLLPRFGHSACLLRDRLILVGGVNHLDSQQPGVAVVHLDTHISVEYQIPVMDPKASLLLTNHCIVVSKDEESLLIVGGGGNCFSFGTFFNKHIAKIYVKDLLS